jgi:hypothetical protein
VLQKFDLVIVGASFAGLSCARTAALRGLKVGVLDAKPDAGSRIRTTGILVKEVTDAFDLPASLQKKLRGVRLYAPNGRSLDLHAPGYYFQATDTATSRQRTRRAFFAGSPAKRNVLVRRHSLAENSRPHLRTKPELQFPPTGFGQNILSQPMAHVRASQQRSGLGGIGDLSSAQNWNASRSPRSTPGFCIVLPTAGLHRAISAGCWPAAG